MYTPASGALQPSGRAPPPGCGRPPWRAFPFALARLPAPARAGVPPSPELVFVPPRRPPAPGIRFSSKNSDTYMLPVLGKYNLFTPYAKIRVARTAFVTRRWRSRQKPSSHKLSLTLYGKTLESCTA